MAVGHTVVAASIASRALNELVSRRAARVEIARRHGPIIAIWVLLVKRFIYPVANKKFHFLKLEMEFFEYNIN